MDTCRWNPHNDLSSLLRIKRITQAMLAKEVGMCESTLSGRLNGVNPWTLDEMYAICDFFNDLDPDNPPMPYDEMYIYFPRVAPAKSKRKLQVAR